MHPLPYNPHQELPSTIFPPPPHLYHPPPAYTPHPPDPVSEGVTIVLKCPQLTSCKSCLKLYTAVYGGVGAIFSSLWVVGHAYVLSQTEGDNLKIQRWNGCRIYWYIYERWKGKSLKNINMNLRNNLKIERWSGNHCLHNIPGIFL